ncbi:PREDICTED: ras-like protein family member 11A [Charadrius vociferus]|uniref:ras-like protein family member 11A n=1 Tax=Charadrius vociferus TaxID=50402 RepID=UPI0005213D3C|nr:PREDICTED: ras-like protein family member 11A [Charadrius vociferus]
MVTTGADDNSMNLWKPKAFSDTREILFTKRKGLTGMMGSEVEILEAIRFFEVKRGLDGNLYSRLVHLEGDQVAVQIQDTPGCIQVQEDCVQVPDSLSRCVKWAEGFLLVYSITDYSSYQSVQPLYQHIRKVHPDARTPVIIVGNKADLLHARQVQAKEGLQLANELGSLFLEISTSDDSQGVCDVFQYLCKEVSKLQHAGSTDRRRSSIIPRPKSPNMQDLKRRFKQALSSKVK